MIFPLAVGFAIGTHDKSKQGIYLVISGLLVFLGFLLAGALEGLFCVLMALPLFLLMTYIGFKFQQKAIKKELEDGKKLMITVTPILLLLLINPIKQVILPEPETITITNSILLDYSAEVVFDEVKQMDKLDAEKPIELL